MSKPITIELLRQHLDHAKSRLSHEKADILSATPLPNIFNREEYAFAYVRAERMGMRAINHELAEISWLPMQLDPSSEVLVEGRSAMKRWLTAADVIQPDSDTFGNDFMHALTRNGMIHGWDTPAFGKLTRRISQLFRDLSCLIGVVYYCTWLAEHGVEEVRVSKPEDIRRTAEEIAILLQSPEIFAQLKAPEQDSDEDESLNAGKNAARKTKPVGKAKKDRPSLRVVSNNVSSNPPETMDPEASPVM